MSIYAVHDQVPKFIFIINYKVMYSALHKMLPEGFSKVQFYQKKQVAKFNLSGFQKFAIVRNPYQRAVSAFFGKCRKSPENILSKENSRLEFSQHQLLNSLKKIRNQPFEIAVPGILFSKTANSEDWERMAENCRILASISFEEYVHCITKILKKKKVDGHFQIQYKAFLLPKKFTFFPKKNLFPKTKIFKLEEINHHWGSICETLGKNMPLRKINRTDHTRPGFETFYTDQTRDMITEAYKIDFEKFGYPLGF